MSPAERFARHHKRQTDRAISQAYGRLATDGLASAAFDDLLHCVRDRSRRLFDAPVENDHHHGVEALVNLARFRTVHLRKIADCQGSPESWQRVVSSLAQHLVCKYSVPSFLASSWWSIDDIYAEEKRQWYVAHGHGASFRSLDLPIVMTRRMEHIFLKSHEHLTIEPAMRRAELVALGAPDEFVRAVLCTRLAADLRNGEFWRTLWTFIVANAGAIDPAQIAPMIDFIQAIRHERFAVETPDGIVTREPPQPLFSMKGRTVTSMLRLMREWHRSLGVAHGGLTWTPSPLRPMLVEEPRQDASEPPTVWQLMELTNGAQLRAEGTALHHCVASYADRCWRGESRIWALRVRRGEKVRHVLTIGVDLRKRAIVQVRGWRNRTAAGRPLRLVRDWAIRERLRL